MVIQIIYIYFNTAIIMPVTKNVGPFPNINFVGLNTHVLVFQWTLNVAYSFILFHLKIKNCTTINITDLRNNKNDIKFTSI